MKQFIRNFNKQKVVGTLNICSLSLSIMVSIVVGLWAINELYLCMSYGLKRIEKNSKQNLEKRHK